MARAVLVTPAVTIVVPVRNGEETIGPCIESLLAQRFPRDRFEIVVVDNGSRDGTVAAVRSFGHDVRLLFESTRGASAARNRGVREAHGTLIAFTDADCTTDPDWVSTLIEPLGDTTVGIAGGCILGGATSNRIARFGMAIHDQRVAIEEQDPPYVITMNWASRRTVLEEAGLFDESLLRSQDVDLSWRLHRAGYRFVYQARAVVYHRNEHTPWGLMHEGFTHGYHAVRLRAKHAALGMRGVDPRTNVGARVRSHLGRLVRGVDPRQAALWLLFDLGKASGELVAVSRGEAAASRRKTHISERAAGARGRTHP